MTPNTVADTEPMHDASLDSRESLVLMYGWIVLAVMNLILIAVAFLRYAA
ncbi:hypothetical protein [Cupriavidus agavae]|uniref:Uncharacterized protein n=1 Tax=Cupriavidus agavae TaxID=1001822 RepID=A0A4Q7S045_9BURK|nr:hypothetical protein [Cupriavidus agavae]RZT39511.1 hypothetical protein EV147_2706 [Cupriavidus agavae]